MHIIYNILLSHWFLCLACSDGYYGEHCDTRCGHCLNNATCHHISGACTQGCEPGYRGQKCIESMLNTMVKYFIFIRNIDRIYLYEFFLIYIKHTHFVSVECPAGYFGENCTSKCGHCLNELATCDYISGSCIGGCKPGYKEPICNTGK